jgi:hypothetical protein
VHGWVWSRSGNSDRQGKDLCLFQTANPDQGTCNMRRILTYPTFLDNVTNEITVPEEIQDTKFKMKFVIYRNTQYSESR